MKKIILAVALLVSGFVGAKAQDKATMTVGADLVSSYVWRGVYQYGASLQPTLSVGYKGLSVGAWGSTDISTLDKKEFDLSVFYTTGALKLGLTDYWWTGQNAPYFKYKESHYFEGTIGYVGSKFSLTWNTIFAGDADKVVLDENGDPVVGKAKYSTYVEGGYSFNVGDVPLALAVGVTPWTSSSNLNYNAGKEGFQVSNISLKATKTVKLSESTSIPVYVQGIIAPAADQTHLVVGVTF